MKYRISIPVQVYDDAWTFIYAPKDNPSGSDHNIGQRIEIHVEAEDDQAALKRIGEVLSSLVRPPVKRPSATPPEILPLSSAPSGGTEPER